MKRFDFPVSFDVADRRCVVIGGDAEATDKARRLLRAGARVQIVAEEVTHELAALAGEGTIGWAARSWTPKDLVGAFAVIVAPDERGSADDIAARRDQMGYLLCVIDAPEPSDFASPALLRAGDLTLTLSTGGRAPALVSRLRRDLEGTIATPRMAAFLDALAARRDAVGPGERSRVGRESIEGFRVEARVTYPAWFERGEQRVSTVAKASAKQPDEQLPVAKKPGPKRPGEKKPPAKKRKTSAQASRASARVRTPR